MGTDKRARQKAGRQQRLQQQAQAQQKNQRNRTVIGLVVVVAIVLGIFAIISLTNKKSKSSASATTVATVSTTAAAPTTAPPTTVKGATGPGNVCPKPDGSSPRILNFTSSPASCLDKSKTYTATIKTTAGTVVMAVDTSKAPAAANSFVFLSLYHYYDNTSLFRVNTGIDIIQGGGPHTQTNGDPGPGFNLTDEPKFTSDSSGTLKGPYTYQPGDVALANTGQPNSAGGQFFFITGPNGANLNNSGTYMVIGHITSGLPILQKIVATAKATAAGSGDGEALPSPPVTITSVTITAK